MFGIATYSTVNCSIVSASCIVNPSEDTRKTVSKKGPEWFDPYLYGHETPLSRAQLILTGDTGGMAICFKTDTSQSSVRKIHIYWN